MGAQPKETLEEMLRHLGFSATVEEQTMDEGCLLDVQTDDSGRLIGRKGQTLIALQYILNRFLYQQDPQTPKVTIDVAGYRSQAREELIKARRGATLFGQAVTNEREKLRIGTSTILDVINTADRLSAAETRATDALIRYAVALDRVRFETGLLLPAGTATRAGYSIEDFLSMPEESQLQSMPSSDGSPNPGVKSDNQQAGASAQAGGSF